MEDLVHGQLGARGLEPLKPVLAQVQKGQPENLTDSWILLTEEKPDIFR